MLRILILTCLAALLLGCNPASNDFVEDNRTIQEKLDDTKNIAALDIPDDATLAETLLYSLGVDKTTRSMFLIGIDANMTTAIAANPNLNKAELDNYSRLAMIALEEEIPRFISEAAKVYEAKYSDEEMLLIMDFYKTDTGQKFIATQSELMSEMVPIGEDLGLRVSKKIEDILEQEEEQEQEQ